MKMSPNAKAWLIVGLGLLGSIGLVVGYVAITGDESGEGLGVLDNPAINPFGGPTYNTSTYRNDTNDNTNTTKPTSNNNTITTTTTLP